MITPGFASASPRFATLHSVIRLATIGVLIVAAVTLLAPVWWVADLVANLRIQLLIALLTALLACLGLRHWRLSIACGLIIGWQLSWLATYAIAPDATGSSATAASAEANEASTSRRLKVCSVNVLTSNLQHDRILSSLRDFDADLIAVLELGSGLSDRLTSELGQEYPYRVLQPEDGGNFGIGLLSRFPLQNVRLFELTRLPLLSISAEADWNGRTVHVVATHPIPPMNERYFQARNEHLQALATLTTRQRRDQPRTPVIVVGDLNVTPWSPHFRTFERTSGLTPSFCGPWFAQVTPTWYHWPAFPFGLVLDHAFSTPDLHCKKASRGRRPGIGPSSCLCRICNHGGV